MRWGLSTRLCRGNLNTIQYGEPLALFHNFSPSFDFCKKIEFDVSDQFHMLHIQKEKLVLQNYPFQGNRLLISAAIYLTINYVVFYISLLYSYPNFIN